MDPISSKSTFFESNLETNISQIKDLGEGHFEQKAAILKLMVEALEQYPADQTPSSFTNAFGRTMAHMRMVHSQAPIPVGKELRVLSKKMDTIATTHGLQSPRPIDSTGKQKLKVAVNSVKKMHGKMIQKGDSDTLLREGKILSTEYWIEFLDKWKRHPAVLNTHFNQWRAYGHCETVDFWTYLNELEKEGSVVYPELFSEDDRVVYLNAEERKAYRCELKTNNEGKVEAIKADGTSFKDGLYITVLGPDNEFYIAEKQPGKFQHASFFGGEAVKSAGMFRINEGVIENFISQSGHYKPEMPEIFHALQRMEKLGLDLSKITLLYGSGGEDKVEIKNPSEWSPYLEFKSGTYQPDKTEKKEQADVLERMKEVSTVDKMTFNFLKKYDGAVLNEDLDALDPVNSGYIDMLWVQFKNTIAKEIGIISPAVTKTSRSWSNSPKSVDEILKAAETMMPHFKSACAAISQKTGAKMSYGPNDACAVKGRESLERKIATDAKQMGVTLEESLATIGDVLRGTVVVQHPKQIPLVVDEIKNYAKSVGGDVVFKNLWIEERASGYIGVHAKLYLPDESGDRMIVELQIHLDAIMDGSVDCVKEHEHKIYEKAREGTIDPRKLNPISKAVFAAALEPVATLVKAKK